MMFSTLHISTSSIKLVTVKGNAIYKWDTLSLEPGLVRDGRIVDPAKVGEAVDKLFHTISAPKNNVIVSVSGLPYTYRVMDFPKMKPEQVEAAMNNNLPSEFTVPLDSLYVSWAPVNIKRDIVEYFVIAVDRQFVDTIIETVKIAGVTDWSLDIRPLALARAAAPTDAIVVSLDNDYMDMVLVQGGKIKNMHSANVDIDVIPLGQVTLICSPASYPN
jgi:Tfp pilus assembly PilM family ATPase